MSFLLGYFRNPLREFSRNELRGYKVTDAGRTRKFGVACRSLEELKRKACAKLGVTHDLAEVNVFLLDGSQVDEEYFVTLGSQTTLILQRPGEVVLSDADLLYDMLKRVNVDYLMAGDEASKFLTETLKEKVALLNSALNEDDTKTACSSRDEHPEWFRGLETYAITKEAYLHRRCQDRVRNYLYKTIEQIKSSDVYSTDREARQHLLCIVEFFKKQLKEDHYFGFYFDRSYARIERRNGWDEIDQAKRCCYDHCPCKLSHSDDETDAKTLSAFASEDSPKKWSDDDAPEKHCSYQILPGDARKQIALCNYRGEFKCEGVWNLDRCLYGDMHRINPYRSREDLILFSTWNLDHTIERARTLVPNLLKTVKEQNIVSQEDVTDFYGNLFTVKNLKLVHIVCHDKGSHK